MESVRISAEKVAAASSMNSQSDLLEITTSISTTAPALTPRADSGLGVSPNPQLLTIVENPHEEDPGVSLMSASVMTQSRCNLHQLQSNDCIMASSSFCPDGAEWGVPGIPGSKDLEAALQRLTLRREANREWRRMRRERLQSAFSTAFEGVQVSTNSHDKNAPASLPVPVVSNATNDQSFGSTYSCYPMSSSRSSTMLNMPGACKKHLQIVKPIEGT